MRDLFSAFRRLSLVAMFGLLALGQAQAANPLEKNFWLSGPRYDGNLPPCESALGKITSRFADKESTFWNSALQITGYDRVHEIAFRPWQSDNIPRRYCAATAMISDGKPRAVYIPSSRMADSPVSATASNSASSGSTATGRTIRPAKPRDLDRWPLRG